MECRRCFTMLAKFGLAAALLFGANPMTALSGGRNHDTSKTFKRTLTLHGPNESGDSDDYVASLAFVGPNGVLVSSYRDASVRIWRLAGGGTFNEVKPHSPDCWGGVHVAGSRNEQVFAAMSSDDDSALWVWNANDNLLTARLRGFSVYPQALAFLSTGALVTVGGPVRERDGEVRLDVGEIRIWDLSDGTSRLLDPGKHALSTIAISPDGKSAVTGDYEGEMTVWNLATGDAVQILKADLWVDSLAYSSDGKLIASAGERIRIWQPPQSEPIHVLERHYGDQRGVTVAFQPGSAVVASTDFDTVLLWDALTGKLVDGFRVAGEQVASLAFSADGKKLAVGCYNGTIEIWETIEVQRPRASAPCRNWNPRRIIKRHCSKSRRH